MCVCVCHRCHDASHIGVTTNGVRRLHAFADDESTVALSNVLRDIPVEHLNVLSAREINLFDMKDSSPLEALHHRQCIDVLNNVKFLGTLTSEEQTFLQELIIATDMAKHQAFMERFTKQFPKQGMTDTHTPLRETSTTNTPPRHGGDDEKKSMSMSKVSPLLLGTLLLKTADLSNVVKPWSIASQWSAMISYEFLSEV